MSIESDVPSYPFQVPLRNLLINMRAFAVCALLAVISAVTGSSVRGEYPKKCRQRVGGRLGTLEIGAGPILRLRRFFLALTSTVAVCCLLIRPLWIIFMCS